MQIRYSILILLGACSAQAEISYIQLKGTHTLLKPECSELSPVYGFLALKTGLLSNIRFFGNYGPRTETYGCHDQIHDQNACPQDGVSALVQQLFPSPDGQNFVANQRMHDPLGNLPPEAVGRVLHLLHSSSGHLDSSHYENWKMALFRALYPQIVLQNQANNGRELQSALKAIKVKKSELANQTKTGSPAEKLSSLQQELESLELRIQQLQQESKSPIEAVKRSKKWEQIEPFSQALFHAMNELHNGHSPYPKKILEHSLLAYAWKKAGAKSDILNLIRELPECITPENRDWILATKNPFPEQVQKLEHWLKDSYTKTQYLNWKSHFQEGQPTQPQISELESNLELAAFYTSIYQDEEKNILPPLAGYATAAHESLGASSDPKRKYQTYPDCGETSLRNFFNILLYNKAEGIFDVTVLEKTAYENHLHVYSGARHGSERGLLAFYQNKAQNQKNISPSHVEDDEVRDRWSMQVASQLTGVKYLKPHSSFGAAQCEINAGIENMQRVIGTLLGDPEWDHLHSSSEKWDRICSLFSRDDFALDYSVESEDSRNAEMGIVSFSINGKPAFEWHFSQTHFYIEKILRPGADQWPAVIYDRTTLKNYEENPWILSAFAPGSSWKFIGPSIFWYVPLQNGQNRLSCVVRALSLKDSSLHPIVKKWIESLPRDEFTQSSIARAALELGPTVYPQFEKLLNHRILAKLYVEMGLLRDFEDLNLDEDKLKQTTTGGLFPAPLAGKLLDIAFSQILTANMNHKPNESYWKIVERLSDIYPPAMVEKTQKGRCGLAFLLDLGQFDLAKKVLSKVKADVGRCQSPIIEAAIRASKKGHPEMSTLLNSVGH